MQNKFIVALLLLVLILTACSSAPSAVPTPTLPHPATPTATLPGSSTAISSESNNNCTLVSQGIMPTSDPTEAASLSLFKPVSDADWILGKNDAAVTILEYSDFQCPYCAALAQVLKLLEKDAAPDVRIVFRHYPLPNHPNSLIGAQAAEAAGLQGKFWEMHDALFTNQSDWAGMDEAGFEAWLSQQADALELDRARFTADLKSAAIVKKAEDARQEGQTIGIPGTPMVLINGRIWQGPRDLENLKAVVQLLKLEKRQFTGCPATVINPQKHYTAILKTDKGEIDIEFFADKAPVTVNSFVFLARQGWFDGIIFHRVIPDFVAQTGDPSGTGYGGPGYAFKDEVDPTLKFDKPGMVGMANAGAGSNGSQFFITLAAQDQLDGKYTVFGQVTSGLDVVKNLTPRDPSKTDQPLPQGDKIISVTINEK